MGSPPSDCPVSLTGQSAPVSSNIMVISVKEIDPNWYNEFKGGFLGIGGKLADFHVWGTLVIVMTH